MKVLQGGLNDVEVSLMTKQIVRVPRTYFEAFSMIQTFAALFALFFVSCSSLARRSVGCWLLVGSHGLRV